MITANDLKVRGVKAIEEALEKGFEAPISVRGKVKYVAITVEQYDEMRTAEINMAYEKVKKDIENGDYVIESVEDHMKRLWPSEPNED